MDSYLLVDEKNSILLRTQEYSSEKKWYMFKSIRPQKSALKAYNSICFHNAHFRKEDENFMRVTEKEKMDFVLQPKCELSSEQKIFFEHFSMKLQECEKKPKSLVIHVRKTKTNKLYSYKISTLLNWKPNLYELKNLIIFKTKSYPLHSCEIPTQKNLDENTLGTHQYKIYL